MARMANEIDAYVGARIRLRRSMLGLSQERLANQLDITFQQVQKYEKGANRVGASRLQAIATILQVPVSYFFEQGEGASGPVESSPLLSDRFTRFVSSSEGLELNRAFLAIDDPKVRRALISLAKSLAGPADTAEVVEVAESSVKSDAKVMPQ
ncbi:helix-turn-helix transcriptional regulator [Ciceribacter sp. L1K23]|nr:helix-turn-helix transcriptional regulator [Ciceribacter sp. L1K22]MBR0557097.1 helix-turn-helix transcriptional regulator [Ciceribacter sp. L1K23]